MMNKSKQTQILISSDHLIRRGSWYQCLEAANTLGVAGLEIFGEDIVSGNLSGIDQLQMLREQSSSLGLEITLHPWFDGSKWDVETAVNITKDILIRAQHLGASTLNFHLNFFATPTQGVKRIARIFEPLMSYIEENGYLILFENVPHYLDNPLGSEPDEFKDFFHLMGNHPNIALNVDIGHANICGNFARFANELSSYWKYTHLADNFGKSDDHLGVGMGTTDWSLVFRTAAELNYAGPFVIEFSESHLSQSEPILADLLELYGWTWSPLNLGSR